MNISGVRPGDVVEVDKRGRAFHALVRGHDQRELVILPLTRGVTWQRARAREIVGHWRASKATRAAKGWDT